jgi:translation initiation factor 1
MDVLKELDDLLNNDKDETKINIRIQQRNGRKSITSISGLNPDLDLKKILKTFKKSLNCNGAIIEDETLGKIIQLQGDQRASVKDFFIKEEIISEENIIMHSF